MKGCSTKKKKEKSFSHLSACEQSTGRPNWPFFALIAVVDSSLSPVGRVLAD